MTDISHNLIGKIDNSTIAVLFEIDTITRDLNFDFFLKKEDSDYDLSSAHFLGLDMVRLADRATKDKLTGILEREAASKRGHQLAMNVLKQSAFQNESYERIVAYFDALLRGLVGRIAIP